MYKIMKKGRLLIGLITLFGYSSSSSAQGFEKIHQQIGYDYNHYSIETNMDGEEGAYVCAGTLFNYNGGPMNNEMDRDIHVVKLDKFGNILWERIIDESIDDRALDLAIDIEDNIIVTGYVSPNGIGEGELYVVKFNESGVFIADRKFSHNGDASAGTNIIYSETNKSYIVGGLNADKIEYPLVGNKAILLELDLNLNLTGSTTAFNAGPDRHSSINDIVEITNGYFVTGSLGNDPTLGGLSCSPGVQHVLAIFVDSNLNMVSDNSFSTTNSEHNGVSAVFDKAADKLYLLSNNSWAHNPQITTFSNVTSSPTRINDYFLELDPGRGPLNPAGFQLRAHLTDSRKLVAMGYFNTYDNATHSDNTSAWHVEFDKDDGAGNGWIWQAPSPGFQGHGDDVFSTFTGEHPYIFEQEIFTEREDGQGYVFIAPNSFGGYYGIDLVTTGYGAIMNCFEPLVYNSIRYENLPCDVHPNTDGFVYNPTNSSPRYNPTSFNSFTHYYCNSPEFRSSQNASGETIGSTSISRLDELESVPNPTSGLVRVNLTGENLTGQLILLNTMGQEVYRSTELSGDYFTTVINLENFEKGIYILQYTNGDQRLIKKLIKI